VRRTLLDKGIEVDRGGLALRLVKWAPRNMQLGICGMR
jgi:hypothetical protein